MLDRKYNVCTVNLRVYYKTSQEIKTYNSLSKNSFHITFIYELVIVSRLHHPFSPLENYDFSFHLEIVKSYSKIT